MSCVRCRRLSMHDGVKMHGDGPAKRLIAGHISHAWQGFVRLTAARLFQPSRRVLDQYQPGEI